METTQCPTCGVTVRTDRLQRHIQRVHTVAGRSRDAQSENLIRCPKCNMKIRKGLFENHLRIIHVSLSTQERSNILKSSLLSDANVSTDTRKTIAFATDKAEGSPKFAKHLRSKCPMSGSRKIKTRESKVDEELFCRHYEELVVFLGKNPKSEHTANTIQREWPNIHRAISYLTKNKQRERIIAIIEHLQPLWIHSADLAMFLIEIRQLLRKREVIEDPNSVVNNKRSKKRREESEIEVDKTSISAQKVPWKILPKGKLLFSQVINHFRQIQQKNVQVRYDIERLQKMQELQPEAIYIGLEEFDGYVVFYFEKNRTAVLECPVVGNAIYVIRGDWRKLSQLTKKQLLELNSTSAQRIIHSGDWFLRLEKAVRRL